MDELVTVGTAIHLPADTAPERRQALVAFIKANFTPRVSVASIAESGLTGQVVVQIDTWAALNEQCLAELVALYLSGDLVSIGDAAAACGVPVERIIGAVVTGRLREYTDPRKGGKLVSLAECQR